MAAARRLVEVYGGEVPRTVEELVTLPGVGRKTANVVVSNAYGVPAIAVDTHVGRLARRLGFSKHDDPDKVEADLQKLFDAGRLGLLAPRLDPARPARVRGAQARLRRVRAGGDVPVAAGLSGRPERQAKTPRSAERTSFQASPGKRPKRAASRRSTVVILRVRTTEGAGRPAPR